MKRFLMLLMTLGIAFACEKSELPTAQKHDQAVLEKMREEIMNKIFAVRCENAKGWSVQPLGSKACGGPQEYVPYPEAADESGELLKLIEKYTAAQVDFNRKYNIVSNCMLVMPPDGVRCEDGKPVLYYKERTVEL